MTTKTTKHEVLLDKAEQMFLDEEYAKGANLVWQATYQALKYAALPED